MKMKNGLKLGLIIGGVIIGLVIIILIFSLIFTGENTSEIKNSLEELRAKSSLYKKPISFEGYKYCNFVFDVNEEDWVKDNEFVFKKFCDFKTGYPPIKDFLYDEFLILLFNNPDLSLTAALYVGNARIEVNKKFAEAKNLDFYLAHEIAHSSTETLFLPDWLNEGIAQYSAYRYFGTLGKLNSRYWEGLLKWDPHTASIGDNIKGYYHSGYVLKMFVKNYGDETFKSLLFELDGKMKAGDSIDIKNIEILNAVRKVTGNQTIELIDIVKPAK